MSKWNNFCKNVSQLTEKAIKKTEELTDIAALHVKIKTLEGKINEQYENLGALTYSKLKGGVDTAEEISHIVSKIDEYLSQIAAYKLKLAKSERDSKKTSAEDTVTFKATTSEESTSCEETDIESLISVQKEEDPSEIKAAPLVLTVKDDEDPKLIEAIQMGIENGKISTSLMQRKLGIGYGRAAKLIDRMAELGWVSEPCGNSPRAVLINEDDFKAILEHSAKK